MCLELRTLEKPKTEQTVYKLYQYFAMTGNLYSPYRGTRMDGKEGEEIVSSRFETALTDGERMGMRVFEGFHVFNSLEDVCGFFKENNLFRKVEDRLVIAECKAKPENFVGAGTFFGQNVSAYTKLTFQGIIIDVTRDGGFIYRSIEKFYEIMSTPEEKAVG